MNYCENCKLLIENADRCNSCGKKLREAQEDDFCFLAEMSESWANSYEESLAAENIPCVLSPIRSTLAANWALPATRYHVFLPFAHYERGRAMLREDLERQKELLLRPLKENIDKIHIQSPRLEKKVQKKLKIPKSTDVLSVIKEKIVNCDKIVDGGNTNYEEKIHRQLFIYFEGFIFTVLSDSYELIAIN